MDCTASRLMASLFTLDNYQNTGKLSTERSFGINLTEVIVRNMSAAIAPNIVDKRAAQDAL